MMAHYKISGLPVVDNDNKLVGIITNRDVKYQEDLDLKVEEIMTKDNLIFLINQQLWKKQKKFC